MKRLLFVPLDWHRDSEGHFDDEKKALATQFDVMIFEKDLDKIISFQPEIILFQGSVSPADLQAIKHATKATVIMYTGDCAFVPPQSFMEQKDNVDFFLIPFLDTSRTYQKALQKPINYLWEYIQDWRFQEPKELNGGTTTFIGNIYDHLPGGERRKAMINLLSVHCDGFQPWGNGAGMKHAVDYKETPVRYNNSFITIAENNLSLDGYFTPRNIGGMAAGSCVMHRWFPRIEMFIRHMEDGMVYHNEYELLQQINFLKANPEIRNQIAQKSYHTAKQYWSLNAWAKNLSEIISKYEETLAKPTDIKNIEINQP